MADMNDDDLLDALGVEVPSLKTANRTPREERIIAGFEDILRFYQGHGRAPLHGEGRDIFERAVDVAAGRVFGHHVFYVHASSPSGWGIPRSLNPPQ